MIRKRFLIAALILFAAPAFAGTFVRSWEITEDTFMRQTEATTNFSSEVNVNYTGDNGVRQYPIIRFTVPELNAGESLDSAYVVGFNTCSNIADSEDEYEVHLLLRDVVIDECTWNRYSTGESWSAGGAQHPSDADYSTDWGLGANGIISIVDPPAINPESTLVVRGSAFKTFLETKAGDTVALVLQNHAFGDSAAFCARSYEDGTNSLYLRYWGRSVTTGSRRKAMLNGARQ